VRKNNFSLFIDCKSVNQHDESLVSQSVLHQSARFTQEVELHQ